MPRLPVPQLHSGDPLLRPRARAGAASRHAGPAGIRFVTVRSADGADAYHAIDRDPDDPSGWWVGHRREADTLTQVDAGEPPEELRCTALGDPGPPVDHDIL